MWECSIGLNEYGQEWEPEHKKKISVCSWKIYLWKKIALQHGEMAQLFFVVIIAAINKTELPSTKRRIDFAKATYNENTILL